MTTILEATPSDPRELVIARVIDAPRDKVWRCWTEPELIRQWFVPKPWTIAAAEVDPRPGGASNITMRDPDGNEFPSPGVYLEVVPNEKLVFTDAFTAGWKTSEKPFFVAVLTFEEEGGEGSGRTRYVARARHWTDEDMEAHRKMGFEEGWGMCADQLEELAKTL